MADYMLLMHDDEADTGISQDWGAYLEKLRSAGVLRGGSAIGPGICVRRRGVAPGITAHLTGFIRVDARDIDHLRELLTGNPMLEAGGTVEIRELPRTD